MENQQKPQSEILNLDDAINTVHGREHNSKLMQAEIFFTKRVNSPSLSLEEKGETYYYLLRCKLKRNALYETPDMQHLYKKMHECFIQAEKDNKCTLKTDKTHAIGAMQLKAFYHLMNYHYGSLEQMYTQNNFQESATQAFIDKMHYRKHALFHNRRWFKWLGYVIYDLTACYGHSFLRWAVTGLVTVVGFAALYALIDSFISPEFQMVGHEGTYYDYIYFSVVTFVTLGYGDITPVIFIQKLLSNIEVIFGYFMLGIWINIMNSKL